MSLNIVHEGRSVVSVNDSGQARLPPIRLDPSAAGVVVQSIATSARVMEATAQGVKEQVEKALRDAYRSPYPEAGVWRLDRPTQLPAPTVTVGKLTGRAVVEVA